MEPKAFNFSIKHVYPAACKSWVTVKNKRQIDGWNFNHSGVGNGYGIAMIFSYFKTRFTDKAQPCSLHDHRFTLKPGPFQCDFASDDKEHPLGFCTCEE